MMDHDATESEGIAVSDLPLHDPAPGARRRRKAKRPEPAPVATALPTALTTTAATDTPPAAAADTPPAYLEIDDLLPILEAMLFAAHESLSAKRLARALGRILEERVTAAILELKRRLDERRSPLMLVEIAGGWRIVTRPEYAPYLSRLFFKAEKDRLSPAALETLAIVAYRQPTSRAEVEAVRGVQAGPLLKVLQERRLVKVVGRAEVVGRPLQYGTTKRFLDHFGLASIEDLPKVFPTGKQAWANGAATNGTAASHPEAAPPDVASGITPETAAEATPGAPGSEEPPADLG